MRLFNRFQPSGFHRNELTHLNLVQHFVPVQGSNSHLLRVASCTRLQEDLHPNMYPIKESSSKEPILNKALLIFELIVIDMIEKGTKFTSYDRVVAKEESSQRSKILDGVDELSIYFWVRAILFRHVGDVLVPEFPMSCLFGDPDGIDEILCCHGWVSWWGKGRGVKVHRTLIWLG